MEDLHLPYSVRAAVRPGTAPRMGASTYRCLSPIGEGNARQRTGRRGRSEITFPEFDYDKFGANVGSYRPILKGLCAYEADEPWSLVYIGNFLGSLFVAFFLVYRHCGCKGIVGPLAAFLQKYWL